MIGFLISPSMAAKGSPDRKSPRRRLRRRHKRGDQKLVVGQTIRPGRGSAPERRGRGGKTARFFTRRTSRAPRFGSPDSWCSGTDCAVPNGNPRSCSSCRSCGGCARAVQTAARHARNCPSGRARRRGTPPKSAQATAALLQPPAAIPQRRLPAHLYRIACSALWGYTSGYCAADAPCTAVHGHSERCSGCSARALSVRRCRQRSPAEKPRSRTDAVFRALYLRTMDVTKNGMPIPNWAPVLGQIVLLFPDSGF
jgi:hypothetical protein